MRKLRGSHNHDPPLFHVGITDRIFNVAVLDSRRLIPALYFHKPRLFRRAFIVTVADRRMVEDIVRILFMQPRRSVLHRFVHVKHKRQFFVFNPDRTHSLRGRHLIFRDHGCHIIPVKSHVLHQQQTVCHILMRLFRGPWMSCRGIIVFWYVETGDDLYHSRNLFRLGCID